MSKRPYLALLTVAAVCILPVSARAQAPGTFGVKGGLTASTLSVEEGRGLDVSAIWGAAAGVFVTRPVSEMLSLQVEALVSQRGARDETAGRSTTVRLAYLDVPVLVRLGSTSADRLHAHAFAGPTFGFKLKADGPNDSIFGGGNTDGEVKTFDLGLTLGAGIDVDRITVDARYTIGMNNIAVAPSDGVVKNRSFALMVGYRFR